MSEEQCDSEVMKKKVSNKETVQHQNNMLADFRTSFSGIRQGITYFEKLINELFNELENVEKQVLPTESKLTNLKNSIQKELNHFVETEVCEAIMKETTSDKHFDSKVMQENVSTKDTIQHQNGILADVCTNFRGIRQGITNFEGLMKESYIVLEHVKKQVVPTETKLKTFENSIQKELNYCVEDEVCKAIGEVTISAEKFDSEVTQKKVSTKETIQQQKVILADVCTSFSGIKQGITNFEELMKESFILLENVKKQVVPTDARLTTLENSIQKELNNFVEAENCEAFIEEKISSEQFDSNDMQKDISIKERKQQQNRELANVCTSLKGIRQVITNFFESMTEYIIVLVSVKEQVDSAEKKLSTLENSINKQLEHAFEAEVCKVAMDETISAKEFDSKDM